MAVIVDSSGWLEYFLNGPLADVYARHLSSEVLVPTIVLYEVYKALKPRLAAPAVSAALAQMAERETIPLGENLALAAAESGLAWRLPMADAIIYAAAQDHGVPLVSSDSHFADLPGVEYVAKPNGEG